MEGLLSVEGLLSGAFSVSASSFLGAASSSRELCLGSELAGFSLFDGAAPPVSMRTKSWPTTTVSSSLARNSLIVPASGALTATSI